MLKKAEAFPGESRAAKWRNGTSKTVGSKYSKESSCCEGRRLFLCLLVEWCDGLSPAAWNKVHFIAIFIGFDNISCWQSTGTWQSWKQYSYNSVISPFQAPIPHIPLFASVLPFPAVWGCRLRLQCWEVREIQCWNGELWLLPLPFQVRSVTPNPFSSICTSFWKPTCRVVSQVENQKGHKIHFMLYWVLGPF